MRGHIGVVALLAGLFAAGVAAAAIPSRSSSPLGVTTDVSTESTTGDTSTAPATTTAAPTVPVTTTTSPLESRTVLVPLTQSIPGRCVSVAVLAVLEPNRPARMLVAPRAGVLAYPADGSIVTAASALLRSGRCARGSAEVRSLSLFGGAVTAARVALRVRGEAKEAQVTGLAVGGRRVAAKPGARLPVRTWGYAIVRPASATTTAGLVVHLTAPRAGLSAETDVFVSFASLPAPPKTASAGTAKPKRPAPHVARPRPRTAKPATHVTRPHPTVRKRHHDAKPRRKHRRGDNPLKVTPPLGLDQYVFPVAGASSYIDTYGAFRGDVPGNWHHGDDIFAALGTPVVAVADGTLNRVGWQRLGGWRLWVRDSRRNEFYYAHLSGYSPLALHSKRVKAGDVIGYIGNTGDAFTTSPHLHFEIHPVSLLRLDYNGAVNPTTYLDNWRRVARRHAPVPAHPPFPAGPVRAETRFVWRQLLAARGLIKHAPRPSERPPIHVPHPDPGAAAVARRTAATINRVHRSGTSSASVFGLLVAGLAAPGLTGAALALRRRRRPS